jgi:methyl-accepting chemotaxis protein
LSLRAKLAAGFGFSVVIILIIAAMALYDTSRLTRLTAARATARQFLWNLEQLVSLTRSAENDARGYLLTGNPEFIATFENDIKRVPACSPIWKRAIRRAAMRCANCAHRRRQGRLAADADRAASPRGPQTSLAQTRPRWRTTSTLSALRSEGAKIRDEETEILRRRSEEATAAARRTRVTIIGGTIVATIALLLVGFLISDSITRRVGDLRSGAERIRQGDLSYRIDDRSHDDVGRLGQAFNQMAAALQSQNRAIGESGATIAERARVLTHGSEALLDRSRKQTQLTEDATGATRNCE